MNLNKVCYILGRLEGDLHRLIANSCAGTLNEDDTHKEIRRIADRLGEAGELIFGDDPDTAKSGVDRG